MLTRVKLKTSFHKLIQQCFITKSFHVVFFSRFSIQSPNKKRNENDVNFDCNLMEMESNDGGVALAFFIFK